MLHVVAHVPVILTLAPFGVWRTYRRISILMPTFSRTLEQSQHRAFALANERHHEYATLEHLLLALVDDQDAADVMQACNVDMDHLRRCLVTYVESELEELVTEGAQDSKPTAGFQRVIQRAVIHVQSSGREEVTGGNVLVAIFAERESHAAYFLQEQGMTRYDAVNYITHGIKKPEAGGTFVGHASVTSLTTAGGIGAQTSPLMTVAQAAADGATQAIVQAITGAVSYRLDGVAPTSTVGMQLAAGQTVSFNMADAADALFISSSGTVFVTFTR
jgi:hypothetical protein